MTRVEMIVIECLLGKLFMDLQILSQGQLLLLYIDDSEQAIGWPILSSHLDVPKINNE